MVAERAETVFVEARKMSFVWKREKGIDIVSLFPAVRWRNIPSERVSDLGAPHERNNCIETTILGLSQLYRKFPLTY
jgi:hypothetical protein